jgi:hypothetical protein
MSDPNTPNPVVLLIVAGVTMLLLTAVAIFFAVGYTPTPR